MGAEVLHYGEDALHSADIVVAGVSMSNGLPAERVFLILEGKCDKSVAVEQGDGYFGGVKMTGSKKKRTYASLKGDKRMSLPPLKYSPGLHRKKKPMYRRSEIAR